MIPAPEWTPTNAEYHATPGRWSSSRLSLFRRSPWEAYQRMVAGAMPPDEPSTAMELGSAVSQALTDPPAIGQHVYRVDVKSRNKKAFRQAREAYSGERIVLTVPEHEAVEGMLAAFHDLQTPMAKLARALLLTAPGFGEYGHRWKERAGGTEIPCMAKVDRLIELDGRPALVELKTSRDASPEGFSRLAWNFSYHCQAAFYRRGIANRLGMATPVDLPTYYVVVGNAWPHELMVYRPDRDYMALGDKRVQADLERLAWALAGGPERWRAEHELQEVIPSLGPPAWAMKKAEAGPTEAEDNEEEGWEL